MLFLFDNLVIYMFNKLTATYIIISFVASSFSPSNALLNAHIF